MTDRLKLPLLQDHHSHPLLYASFAQTVPLFSVESRPEADNLLREFALGGHEIVVAHGWRSNLFDWSDEEFESLPPTAVFNVSLHALKLNPTGLEVLRGRFGGQVDNVSDQEWFEDHFRLVLNWFANLYASEQALRSFYDDLETIGVGFAEELLLIDEQEIELFQNTNLDDRTRFWSAPDTFEQLSSDAKNQVCGLKLFTDGAIGARTAALSRPYLAGPSAAGQGKLIYSDGELDKLVGDCLHTQKALAIHAIGDVAIQQSVSILENHRDEVLRVPEVRIEHAQMIDRATANRVKDLGVVLSMQPNFSGDSTDYRDRLDESFCSMNNPFRMLIDKVGFRPGEDLVFGSDGMPHGIEYALQQSLFPSVANQRLTVDEFQAGYCYPQTEKTIEVEIDEHLQSVTIVGEPESKQTDSRR